MSAPPKPPGSRRRPEDAPAEGRALPEPREVDSGAAAFAWLCWAAAFGVAAVFVWRFGPRVPIWDDYAVIPALTGRQPVTLGWLWSQHSEHRIFLPRLILLAGFRWTGYDFRAGMFVNVALLAALAAAVPAALAVARRGWRYSDALYPLLLLNLGHHANLLWNIEVAYVLPVALGGAVLSLIAARPGLPGPARGVAIGTLLALMPLCNAAGVALTPIPALWLIGAAVAHARSGRAGSATRGLAVGASAVPALALTALYFHDFERATHHPPPPGPWPVVRTTVQFLGTGLGPAGMELGPAGGWLVVALMAAAAGVLVRSVMTRPEVRPRATGILAAWCSVALLAVGTGWGRAGLGELAGMQVRYVTLAAPAVLVGAVAFELFGPGATRRLVPMTLLCLLCVLLWPNTTAGLDAGRVTAARSDAFLKDLKAGVPAYLLVRRHTPYLYPTHADLAASLAELRDAGIAPFDRIAPDPPLRAVPIDPEPESLRLARWDGRTIEAVGVDPQAVFALPGPPGYVAGIRLRYSHANPEGEDARFKLAWRKPGQVDFPGDQEYFAWALPTGPGRSTTIWIGEPVDRIRLQPDNRPCTFTIEELTLLVPESMAPAP